MQCVYNSGDVIDYHKMKMLGSMLERASLGPPSPRRTAWSTGRRAWVTTRGWGSTATSGTTARPTPSSTAPVSMGSGWSWQFINP